MPALNSYDFSIRYRCEKSNSDADGLSPMSIDYDVFENESKVISMEIIHTWLLWFLCFLNVGTQVRELDSRAVLFVNYVN